MICDVVSKAFYSASFEDFDVHGVWVMVKIKAAMQLHHCLGLLPCLKWLFATEMLADWPLVAE